MFRHTQTVEKLTELSKTSTRANKKHSTEKTEIITELTSNTVIPVGAAANERDCVDAHSKCVKPIPESKHRTVNNGCRDCAIYCQNAINQNRQYKMAAEESAKFDKTIEKFGEKLDECVSEHRISPTVILLIEPHGAVFFQCEICLP